MIAERWGSLSVADHVSTRDLMVNVLLYDRLIVPVMAHQEDRNERAYWLKKKWDPDLQRRRVEQLRGLAIPRPWDRSRRDVFKSRMSELEAERFDTRQVDELAKATTRMILAMEPVTEKNPGVERVEVVAAYNSAAAVEKDFLIKQPAGPLAAQALLVTRRLAVPKFADEEAALRCAIDLSIDQDFRAKRSELFDWQETAIANRWSPKEAVERLSEMNDAYNEKVKAAAGAVRWKLAFMICGIGLGFATGGVAGAAAGAALSTVQFLKLDRKPAIDPGNTSPAAMFHAIKTKLGIQLK